MEAPSYEIELELTYLAKEVPKEILSTTPIRMSDIYIPGDRSTNSKLRLRDKGGLYEITKKELLDPADASMQREYTIKLTAAEFNALRSASNSRVVKDRYNVTIGSNPVEVDVFQEQLHGLVVIDFEFPNLAARASFMPPECCLVDITQEDFIAGGNLAGKSYQDIEPHLTRLGYQSLYLNK